MRKIYITMTPTVRIMRDDDTRVQLTDESRKGRVCRVLNDLS